MADTMDIPRNSAKHRLLTVAGFLSFVVFLASFLNAADRPPNVILMFADD